MYLKDKGTMTLCSHKQGEIGYGLIMGHHTGGSLTRAFLIEMRTPNGFLKTIPPKVERITGRWICPEQHIVTQFDIIDHPLAPTIPRSRAFCLKNIDS
jgi:hypothetical protein